MYKWTVYLNNKHSEEEPQAWSVVRKKKINLKFNIALQQNLKRCSFNTPKEARHKNHLWTPHPTQMEAQRQIQSWPRAFPVFPTDGGLTASLRSCVTAAHRANCLQKGKERAPWWASAVNNLQGGERPTLVAMVVMMTLRCIKCDMMLTWSRVLCYSLIIRPKYVVNICHFWQFVMFTPQ